MPTKKHPKVPWTDVVNVTSWYIAYRDIVDGKVARYLYVPKEDNAIGISTAIVGCYQMGLALQSIEQWAGFQILIRVGKEIEKEVDLNYIELLPIGDTHGSSFR